MSKFNGWEVEVPAAPVMVIALLAFMAVVCIFGPRDFPGKPASACESCPCCQQCDHTTHPPVVTLGEGEE